LHFFYNEIENRLLPCENLASKTVQGPVAIAERATLDVSDDTMGTADELIVIVAIPRQSSKAAADPLLRAQTCTI
jgi:hypothetical protein